MQQPQSSAPTSIDPTSETFDAGLASQPVVLELDVLDQVAGAGPYGGWAASKVVTPLGPYGGWY